jgi:hypothetical protein
MHRDNPVRLQTDPDIEIRAENSRLSNVELKFRPRRIGRR